jgi:transcriptional regulator with XRE-family HTH domain
VFAVEAPVVMFAGLLRQLRLSAGLSQEELAERQASECGRSVTWSAGWR